MFYKTSVLNCSICEQAFNLCCWMKFLRFPFLENWYRQSLCKGVGGWNWVVFNVWNWKNILLHQKANWYHGKIAHLHVTSSEIGINSPIGPTCACYNVYMFFIKIGTNADDAGGLCGHQPDLSTKWDRGSINTSKLHMFCIHVCVCV